MASTKSSTPRRTCATSQPASSRGERRSDQKNYIPRVSDLLPLGRLLSLLSLSPSPCHAQLTSRESTPPHPPLHPSRPPSVSVFSSELVSRISALGSAAVGRRGWGQVGVSEAAEAAQTRGTRGGRITTTIIIITRATRMPTVMRMRKIMTTRTRTTTQTCTTFSAANLPLGWGAPRLVASLGVEAEEGAVEAVVSEAAGEAAEVAWVGRVGVGLAAPAT